MSELSALNLAEDLKDVLGNPDAERWVIEHPEALEVRVKLSSVKDPKEIFQARFLWERYPDDPPSLKFRDLTTGQLDNPKAWPVVRGFRPQSLDACVNWCSEGFVLHPEWKADPNLQWDHRGNALLRALRTLQNEMDDHFEKRFTG